MIKIRSETELYEVLDRFKGDPWEEVEFEGYPRFNITLRGERFDGGIPTKVMQALLEFQKEIDKIGATLYWPGAAPSGAVSPVPFRGVEEGIASR